MQTPPIYRGRQIKPDPSKYWDFYIRSVDVKHAQASLARISDIFRGVLPLLYLAGKGLGGRPRIAFRDWFRASSLCEVGFRDVG